MRGAPRIGVFKGRGSSGTQSLNRGDLEQGKVIFARARSPNPTNPRGDAGEKVMGEKKLKTIPKAWGGGVLGGGGGWGGFWGGGGGFFDLRERNARQ